MSMKPKRTPRDTQRCPSDKGEKEHKGGPYVLAMDGPAAGTLALLADAEEADRAEVQFEGTHRLTFGHDEFERPE
jgi:hypothetical protein